MRFFLFAFVFSFASIHTTRDGKFRSLGGGFSTISFSFLSEKVNQFPPFCGQSLSCGGVKRRAFYRKYQFILHFKYS